MHMRSRVVQTGSFHAVMPYLAALQSGQSTRACMQLDLPVTPPLVRATPLTEEQQVLFPQPLDLCAHPCTYPQHAGP
jgi:hypothetical protein